MLVSSEGQYDAGIPLGRAIAVVRGLNYQDDREIEPAPRQRAARFETPRPLPRSGGGL